MLLELGGTNGENRGRGATSVRQDRDESQSTGAIGKTASDRVRLNQSIKIKERLTDKQLWREWSCIRGGGGRG